MSHVDTFYMHFTACCQPLSHLVGFWTRTVAALYALLQVMVVLGGVNPAEDLMDVALWHD